MSYEKIMANLLKKYNADKEILSNYFLDSVEGNFILEGDSKEDISVCPVCGNKMDIVKLYGNKSAYFCSHERACIPLKTNS